MNVIALTIFPELFKAYWAHGILRRAIENRLLTASAMDIRDFARGRHKVTDDRPYGGGTGMVMKPEPLADAIDSARQKAPGAKVLLLSPQGRPFNQEMAGELATEPGLVLVSGRYEGIDERIYETRVDLEVSIGDFVLTGGELAAMVIMDAVVRLLPGCLGGGPEATQNESFQENLLEHAHFTRPPEFEGRAVPEVLTSGNHGEIERWRAQSALARTLWKRPDLLENRPLTKMQRTLLKKWYQRLGGILQSQTVSGPDSLPGGKP